MENKMYNWLKNVINNEYRFIRNIRRTDDTIINVMENQHNGERVLVKEVLGSALVYKELIKITHKNIPIVYEVASDETHSIIVEEYIDGITVGDILETGVYTSDGVRTIVTQLSDALYFLHGRGIVHRDIKPENIMISNEGEVKLVDFDISRIKGNEGGKDTVILGTTGFAAPEQFGISETDARSDIYAIGILINVMLTGEHPAKVLCKGKWRRIVNKCTKINPDERYQTVEEMIKAMKYIGLG